MTTLNELLAEYEALRRPHVPNSPLCGHDDACPVCDGSGVVYVAAIHTPDGPATLDADYEIAIPCPGCSVLGRALRFGAGSDRL